MAVTDDAVWVTSSHANHVVRLDATTNKPDAVITLEKPCAGLAVGFGSLWIPSCGSHNLARVDVKTGAIQATIVASPADSEGGITVGAGSVWLVVSATSELDRIDPKTNAVVAKIELPKGSFNPIFAEDSVWVASNAGNALVRVDPKANKVVGSTAIGPKPRFLTVGEGFGVGPESGRRHDFAGGCEDGQAAGNDCVRDSGPGRGDRLWRRVGVGDGLWLPDYAHRP